MKVENRTFIVSGGSSGLGLATVMDLLSSNAYIALLDRNDPPAELSSTRVKYFKIDITKVEEIERAVDGAAQWAKETGATLRGVINCAGVAPYAATINAQNNPHPLEVWDLVLAVNVTGTFNLTRLALKHMVHVKPEDGADGERGVIIFVSSAAAYEGYTGSVAYSASKGAIRSMTMPMAMDLSRHAIRVASIAPSMFETTLTSDIPPRTRRHMESRTLLYPERFGQPSEFAQTVRWILECPYVNGETFRLSGGQRASKL